MSPLAAAVARDDAQCAPPRSIHAYRPRAAEHTVLHRIVREHLATFLVAAGTPAASDRSSNASFGSSGMRRVEPRFRTLSLRRLSRGAPRAVLVQGARGAPSCGGRRMAERAAHLVDHVLPAVPIRQWVLSLPFRLRHLLAFDHAHCRRVLAIHVRVLRVLSPPRPPAGDRRRRDRAVTAIQRAGSACNLNVHFHTLVLDGVFTPEPSRWPSLRARQCRRARGSSRGWSQRSRGA